MQKFEVHALHGFMGRPNDWAVLEKKAVCWDIFAPDSVAKNSMSEWGGWLNAKASDSKVPKILLGYSLGGRLALHALMQPMCPWDGAVIISAHTGLKDSSEKIQRIKSDQIWAKRFLTEPWDKLQKAWNAQPVFQYDHAGLIRREQDFNRSTLAHVLENWSLGRQEDLLPTINRLNLPILWIAGGKDKRCGHIANTFSLKHSHSKVLIATECGHRIPWTHTDLLNRELDNFEAILWQHKHQNGKL